MRPTREITDRFRAERQAAVEKADDEAPDLNMGDVEEVDVAGDVARFKINGHWYRSLDTTAGIRAYTGPRGATRFWHGFYNQKAVDHYTGGALAVVVESSSRQEYDIYPELYAQLEQTLGGRPETIIADKGFSVKRVFQHNTERGVATVISYKRAGGDGLRHDHETHDRHGIPRCKHCGGPTNFVRFNESPKPRVWFDCAVGLIAACAKTQSLSCSKDWKLLVPLWRTNPLYHELKHSHSHYEHAHNNWRSRYRVAADDLGIRPKRRRRRLAAPARRLRPDRRMAAHLPPAGMARLGAHQPQAQDRTPRRLAEGGRGGRRQPRRLPPPDRPHRPLRPGRPRPRPRLVEGAAVAGVRRQAQSRARTLASWHSGRPSSPRASLFRLSHRLGMRSRARCVVSIF